ncbi:MAG: 30S ribosomal protein S16 [Actinomycetes bacterium]
MAVKIKLKRIGKMHQPHYRIVIADARTARGGRAIEEIGQYHPIENPSRIQVDSERVQYWLSVGAQPTEAVAAILRVTGDWQSFKGEPAPPAMLVAEVKADKKSVFEAAAKESAGIDEKPATTPKAKKKAAPKADEKPEPTAEAKADEKPETTADEKADAPASADAAPAAPAADAAASDDAGKDAPESPADA